MYTVVDTQATTFLRQRQQRQFAMKDRKKHGRVGTERTKLEGTDLPQGGDIRTVLECGSRQSGCTSGETTPRGERGEQKNKKTQKDTGMTRVQGEVASELLNL